MKTLVFTKPKQLKRVTKKKVKVPGVDYSPGLSKVHEDEVERDVFGVRTRFNKRTKYPNMTLQEAIDKDGTSIVPWFLWMRDRHNWRFSKAIQTKINKLFRKFRKENPLYPWFNTGNNYDE